MSLPELYHETAHEGTLVELDFPWRVDELMREDCEQIIDFMNLEGKR